ncbi:DUF6252 family protein [Flavobacterium rhizosphaerae]|uniref:DUF6252 family protein n=1 Tax=Flavobacterium rhizosphaerae TaxID=3163298 RepID=A0ABW8Z1B7_9FLAO
MRKFLLLFVLLAAFTSCEEDVKFNTPAVQGLKDDVLWKATDFTATKGGDNSLTIQASNGFETLVLKTASITAGTYQLGVDNSSKASYTLFIDSFNSEYETGAGIGSGQITISDNPLETNLAEGYVTGTFRFSAVDTEGNYVYFQQGVFYKVPILGITE